MPETSSLRINISGSTYTISDTNTNIYNESVIGFDNVEEGIRIRKLHSFIGSDGTFYQVHISSADNSSADKQKHHVQFNIIRTTIKTILN